MTLVAFDFVSSLWFRLVPGVAAIGIFGLLNKKLNKKRPPPNRIHACHHLIWSDFYFERLQMRGEGREMCFGADCPFNQCQLHKPVLFSEKFLIYYNKHLSVFSLSSLCDVFYH